VVNKLCAIPVICCCFLLGACVTTHKTYQPPSNAKVEASTKQVKTDIAAAHQLATDSRKSVVEAQKNADTLTVTSATLEGKATELEAAVPDAFKPAMHEIVSGISEMQATEGTLTMNLAQSNTKNDALEAKLVQLETHESQLEQNQSEYYANAQKLANNATAEREFRIKAEDQLVKEKWIRILWKIGGGFVVLVIIALVILYFTGNLGVVLAKVGIKAGV